jgi:NADH-ubiquinone oxidoreductase chain 6
MNNLYITYEYYTNGYVTTILTIFSLLILLFGIFTIIIKNPVISVLFLIGLFAGVSSYLILLGMSFIGLAYLIVYIGAVSILFLFILMLINIRVSELQSNTKNSIPLAVIIGILFNYSSFQLLPYSILILNNNSSINSRLYTFFFNTNDYKFENILDNNILFSTSKIWDGNLIGADHITSLGNIIYTNYSLWLIITSYILLLAMVGAIVITIKQKN